MGRRMVQYKIEKTLNRDAIKNLENRYRLDTVFISRSTIL